ncbi:TetR/AcrR family transcriptional regulator [Labrenzia sp. PHM005]|uniref:TetR/AcrR family transcriptional regulator n=1 Tax=Stappiaceae TaxID=2821832 RepID=UPI00113FD2C7|nr:TetR/AcrR family transcriptional regulator [Labrenzia sp. PHM005]QDG78804.1 TetR/AcrR family transcriptional regulator [Labrenzia sp. PHM005]
MELNNVRRRRPKQQRSRQMVGFILEAATQVFDQNGYEASTTNLIAERAGISIGSLYQYFPNKAALILELKIAHRAQILHAVEGAMASSEHLPLPDAIRRIVDANFQVHLDAPRLNAAFEEVLPANTVQSDQEMFHQKMDSAARTFLSSRHREIATQDLEAAGFVIRNLIRSVLHGAISGGQIVDDPDAIKAHLVHSIMGCLRPPATAVPPH